MMHVVIRRFPNVQNEFGNQQTDSDDHDNQDDDVIDATAVAKIAAPDDPPTTVDDADGEYEDADDDDPAEPEDPPRKKDGRGRPPARFKVAGSRGTWFVEDTHDELNDSEPFATKEEARQHAVKLNREVA